LTIKEAAKQLNLEYRQLLSAVNEGVVPFYQLRRGRKLVSVSEVIAIMKNNQSEI
ncbi:MAG: excisionase family DNA-binding protein, partial [Alphaproteobacteria bacterium]|nr:excisionase family DNA-binding protein [Alphaproteobacteria bacterium]